MTRRLKPSGSHSGPVPVVRTGVDDRTVLERPAITDETQPFGPRRSAQSAEVLKVRVVVTDPEALRTTFASTGAKVCIGSHASNDLVLADPTVSRFHCELTVERDGVWLKDLESTNQTTLDGVVVRHAQVKTGSTVHLGRATLRIEFGAATQPLALSKETRLGRLVGRSVPMRAVFALLEKAADSSATVLLEGETGTGKSQAAQVLHSLSARRDKPFVVVDCGAIPMTLLESELFGHEKGAFTGATNRRAGAFEEANGGTVFIDEIGELPHELQSRLLRALEEKTVKRVGANRSAQVDVRVIAASQSDLRGEVNAGRFRPDLYFRLAVVRVPVPALRERPEDIPLVVGRLLEELRPDPEVAIALNDPQFIARLQHCAWPGNIRELRNHLERCLVMQSALVPERITRGGGMPALVPETGPLGRARDAAIAEFEKKYLTRLLERHHGKVAEAAEEADVDRAYLYRLLKKHGFSLTAGE